MGEPYNNILDKVEDALAARLATISANLQGAEIHPGGGDDDLTLPWIATLATDAEERGPRGERNFAVQAAIEINTSSKEMSRDNRKLLHGYVADAFSTTTIASDLSTDVDDFRCFGFLMNRQSKRVEGKRHIYTIEIELHCCGSDV